MAQPREASKRYVVANNVDEDKEPVVYSVVVDGPTYILTSVRVPEGMDGALGEVQRLNKRSFDSKYEPFNPRHHGPLTRVVEEPAAPKSRPVLLIDADDEDDDDAAAESDSRSDKPE